MRSTRTIPPLTVAAASLALVALLACGKAEDDAPPPAPAPASAAPITAAPAADVQPFVLPSGAEIVLPAPGATEAPAGALAFAPPPGEAPPGKVWSAEHGHWHDVHVPGQAPPAAGLVPQPPGPVPPGKVWSPEHGHWHDVAPPGTIVPQATPGASPETAIPIAVVPVEQQSPPTRKP